MKKSRRDCALCGEPCRGPRDARYIKIVLCARCRRARRTEQIRQAVARWRDRKAA
jgi:hypothetical protein